MNVRAVVLRIALFGLLARVIAPAGAAELRVEVTRLDGITATGELVAVAPELTIRTPSGPLALKWTEILSVRPLVDHSAPAEPARPLRLTLSDGTEIAGSIVDARERDLVVQFGANQTVRLGLPVLASIVSTSATDVARRKLEPRLRAAPPSAAPAAEADTQDLAVVARGIEVLELHGAIKRITPQQVLFEWNGREVPLQWERVAGLVFARATPRTTPCLVRLHGGDTLAGRIASGSADAVTLQSGVFDELVLPWNTIERIDGRSDRLVFLSDLEPRRYVCEPFFDKRWPLARDATLSGRPLRLGGTTFSKGLVLHSRATASYTLGGQFTRFAARVGILDEMGDRGCVALRVLGDGRELWSATGVRGGQPLRDVNVSVERVDELTLVVDFDDDLDLSDQAAWAFARLIR